MPVRSPTPKPLVVAGIMSGTSADGVDVAVCRIAAGERGPELALVAHESFAYPAEVREAVLRACTDAPTSVAELARLNWRLGELYADAVAATCAGQTPDLIGLHGQTIYHQAEAAEFLGTARRATWQIGEPAVLAERLRVPVISDFRTADLAAGGQGAPLVPILDFHFFRHATASRVLLNLGGIANVTLLPAACTLADVCAFDTGPASMVLDALMQHFFQLPFDPKGATAASGRVLPELLAELLQDPYFSRQPPKSCGREQFGTQFAAGLFDRGRPADLLATATELTARTIFNACVPFVRPGTELIASGGGTRNHFLLGRLRELFAGCEVVVRTTDDYGLPSQSKEGAAFALLAWLSWHGLPGNVPAATGASRAVVLGRITCV